MAQEESLRADSGSEARDSQLLIAGASAQKTVNVFNKQGAELWD